MAPYCHSIFRGATCQLLGKSHATNGRITKCKTCRHQSLFFLVLVPVGVKDDAATVPNRIGRSDATLWRHIAIRFSVAPLVSSWANHMPPMAASQNVRHADTKVCSSLSLSLLV